jgi:archaellum component FlaF (FlaF/FlaG flagellin family)
VAVKTPNPKDLQLKVASDPNGHLWVYVFSDQEELSKTFPNGSPFAEMAFIDLLATIGPDSRFGGIFINSNSDAKYLVPRELFSVVFNLIANPPDQKSA